MNKKSINDNLMSERIFSVLIAILLAFLCAYSVINGEVSTIKVHQTCDDVVVVSGWLLLPFVAGAATGSIGLLTVSLGYYMGEPFRSKFRRFRYYATYIGWGLILVPAMVNLVQTCS